jgi:hypothetical protein
MIPSNLHLLFWEVNLDDFNPVAYPEYTIGRILELGDEDAVRWMKETFLEADIRRVIAIDRSLSRKSATYWASRYRMAPGEVAALRPAR